MNNNLRLIALIGPAGCGKTTIAKYLSEEHNYAHLKFADGLKNMLRSIGLTEEELEGDLKETPSLTLMGKTPRHAMQTLGTEWGRNCINKDIWTTLFYLKCSRIFDLNMNVVVDDLRFLNEAKIIKELNGNIIEIVRPGLDESKNLYSHLSETESKDIKADWTIINYSSIDELLKSIDAIITTEL